MVAGLLAIGLMQVAGATSLGDAGRFDTWVGYPVGRSPSAVATADFNGDALVDAAWARRDFFTGQVVGNSLAVQLNLGDGTLSDVVNYPAVDNSNDVAAGDIDGDNDVDLVSVADGSSLSNTSIDVYRNSGNGTFTRESATGGSAGRRVELVDLDGDGDRDLAITNGWGATFTSVLLNQGGGTFGPQQQIAVGDGQGGITSADLDGDGDRDLAVGRLDSNTNESEVVVLTNSGAGVFGIATRIPLSGPDYSGIPSLDAGDVDGDGDSDLAVGGSRTTHLVLRNQGGLSFTTDTYTAGFNSMNIVLADHDGDGDLDIYSATLGSSLTGDVSMLFNEGAGIFGVVQIVESSHQPHDIAAADFTGDGKLDMAVSNQGSGTGAIHPQAVTAAFEAPPTYPTFAPPDTVTIADFDVDGDLDVASSIPTQKVIDIKLNDGSGALTAGSTISSPPGSPTSVWAASLNGDSAPDLVWQASAFPKQFGFALNPGNGTFGAATFQAVNGCGVGRVTTADVDNDGDQDVVVGGSGFSCGTHTSDVSVSLNNGLGAFPTEIFVPVLHQVTMAMGADLNGDGLTDLVGITNNASFGQGDVGVALGTGGGQFASPVSYTVGASHRELALTDLDGDGDTDVTATNLSPEGTAVLLNNGLGQLTISQVLPSEVISGLFNEWAIDTGDVNGDGLVDIVVANRTGKDIGVHFGRGGGTFDSAQLRYGMHTDLTDVELADMNGDGRLDVVGPATAESVTAASGTADSLQSAGADVLAATSSTNGISVLVNVGSGVGGGPFTLTITKAGTGTGTVTSSPTGINCGTDCTGAYSNGTVVTLTATPAAGSTFAGWSGACTGTGSCVVTMNAAKAVTATFNTAGGGPFTLTVTKAGTGTGTVKSSPDGIRCGTDCIEAYSNGTVVTLTATPAAGSTFAGWSGACTGTGSCVVTMNAAKAVTATFNTAGGGPFTLTITKAGTGTGTVTSSPTGINCGTDCTEAYSNGTVVTLTARATRGATFAGWSGACTGTGSCVVTMNAAKAVTATFNASGGVLVE